MFKQVFIIFITFFLLYNVSGANWQSHGNFSNNNITIIHAKIQNKINDVLNNAKNYNLAATQLSDELNALWDPAWNVFIVKIGQESYSTLDGVVDGYAFRDHWLWYNDNDISHLSFIIWKDYNCDPSDWFSWNSYDLFNFTYVSQSDYLSYMIQLYNYLGDSPALITDPWITADHMIKYAQNLIPGSAWTAVSYGYFHYWMMTQYGTRFCCLNKQNVFLPFQTGLKNVVVHMIRMR